MIGAAFVNLTSDENQLLNEQRALTTDINNKFIQVGAVWLKSQSKIPVDINWASSTYLVTSGQTWIDDEDYKFSNMGFNLQLGWMDIDVDSDDSEFNQCIQAAFQHAGIDTRFAFGRLSTGCPAHYLIQLTEDDAANFEELDKFAPRQLSIGNHKHRVQLRTSIPIASKNASLLTERTKQTVVPGSIYRDKKNVEKHDISVWWTQDNQVARISEQIAKTTSRRVSYREILRAVAFGSILYMVKSHWTEGNRQNIASRLFGWLARVVTECNAINDNEGLSREIMCPIDTDDIAESFIEFLCKQTGDDESYMRKRIYCDARKKLEQNPDAKIPGWPSIESTFGSEVKHCLRSVVQPGSDISTIFVYADRYLYDETDGEYIDRNRFWNGEVRFTHQPRELRDRHAPDKITIGGKLKEAFRMFEQSKMRISVSSNDMFPYGSPGTILRADLRNNIVPDDWEEDRSRIIFNTWRGWDIGPTNNPDPGILRDCKDRLDRLLCYLTCDNRAQIDWIYKWIAWIIKYPGDKQQIAWMVVGGHGVGKSFMGDVFLAKLFGRLFGQCASKSFGEKFSAAIIQNKMLVFADEARIKGLSALDEVKSLIRKDRISGELKGVNEREYNNYARFYFASNTLNTGIRQEDTVDRALYITRAYTPEHVGSSHLIFQSKWVDAQKPFFQEFADLMNRRDIISHFMRLFTDMDVTKREIENVSSSAVADPDIVRVNLSGPRRVAKDIVESGYVIEHMDASFPFTQMEFATAVTERMNKMGRRNISAEWVLDEFKSLGMIEETKIGAVIKMRFRWKLGELTQRFGEAIGVPLNSGFEFDEADFGPNECDGSAPVPWRGSNRRF